MQEKSGIIVLVITSNVPHLLPLPSKMILVLSLGGKSVWEAFVLIAPYALARELASPHSISRSWFYYWFIIACGRKTPS